MVLVKLHRYKSIKIIKAICDKNWKYGTVCTAIVPSVCNHFNAPRLISRNVHRIVWLAHPYDHCSWFTHRKLLFELVFSTFHENVPFNQFTEIWWQIFERDECVCVCVCPDGTIEQMDSANKALNKHSDDTQWNQMDKLLQSWRCELTNEKWINTENTLNWIELISLWLPSNISFYFLDTPIDVVVWHCSFTFQKLHQMWSQAKQIEKHWFNFVWWVRGEVMLDFWFFCCCWSKQMVRCGKTIFSTH